MARHRPPADRPRNPDLEAGCSRFSEAAVETPLPPWGSPGLRAARHAPAEIESVRKARVDGFLVSSQRERPRSVDICPIGKETKVESNPLTADLYA